MRLLTAVLRIAVLGLVGCSSGAEGAPTSGSSDSSDTSTGTGGGASMSSGTGAGPMFGSGATGGGGVDDCSDAAKLVYVLTQDGGLFSFHPPTLDLIQVGTLDCPDVAPFSSVFSMSVAHDGTAYVLYGDGNLQRASTVDATCKSSGYVPDQLGFNTFGMGFSSEGADSEALFAAHYGGSGLARIDPATLTMTLVGAYDKLQGAAELSGTGDGRLFGFFKSGAKLAEIEKTTAKILSVASLSVSAGSAWAFAFWGGDFWLFTSPNSAYSEVHRYRPSTGMTEMVLRTPGMRIVGAGVSTCAPLEPPK